MCYLRKFQTVSAISPSKFILADDTEEWSSYDNSFICQKEEIPFDFQKPGNSQTKQKESKLLVDLISMLKYNSQLLDSLQRKINENNQSLDQLNTQISQKTILSDESSTFQTQNSFNGSSSSNIRHFSNQALTQKLFQKKSYKYKLILAQKFPQIIYKERNLSISVSLINSQGNIIRNSNIINLCFGVCDTNGQWISETKSGQNFMKGKTQAQLYHGQSNYSKIYPRDVSRYYQDGKINFVIYPKPSVLNYSGNNSSLESKINFYQIEPLLIKDLTIRAKKKD